MQEYIENSISLRQAVLCKLEADKLQKKTFDYLSNLYSQVNKEAKEAKELCDFENNDSNALNYDRKLAKLLACDYHLRKIKEPQAEKLVNLHKSSFNLFFDIVNDDIDSLIRKIDNPSFDWKSLKLSIQEEIQPSMDESDTIHEEGKEQIQLTEEQIQWFYRVFGRK